jgi:hypothetical protein
MNNADIMNKILQKLLCCPVCLQPLMPTGWKCDSTRNGTWGFLTETMEVTSHCSKCITRVSIESEPLARRFWIAMREYRASQFDCLCGQGQTCEACH